jgi:hypothetical protein
MKVKLHPDGYLYVRDVNGVIVYAEMLANAAADSDVILQLPGGMVALEYSDDDGLLCYYDARGNAYPREGSGGHAECDAIIARLPSMLAAKALRETPLPPSPEQIASQQRLAEIDQDIQTATIGTVDPKTVAQLKAMTKVEFFAWFDANVPVTAQAIYALVRRLTLIVIRRVL